MCIVCVSYLLVNKYFIITVWTFSNFNKQFEKLIYLHLPESTHDDLCAVKAIPRVFLRIVMDTLSNSFTLNR